jgi:hypothetical protein
MVFDRQMAEKSIEKTDASQTFLGAGTSMLRMFSCIPA